jgi:hypothetical protein
VVVWDRRCVEDLPDSGRSSSSLALRIEAFLRKRGVATTLDEIFLTVYKYGTYAKCPLKALQEMPRKARCCDKNRWKDRARESSVMERKRPNAAKPGSIASPVVCPGSTVACGMLRLRGVRKTTTWLV